MKIERDGVDLHVRVERSEDGPPVMFANSLGTTLRLWDGVVAALPPGLRVIRYDMRGHGQSDVPPPPYSMGQLVSDAEAVADHLEVRDCVFVGLSVGGMVAQGLAVKRPEIARALVLSNTAAKIGNAQLWEARIATIRDGGLGAIADAVMRRWFGPGCYGTPGMEEWLEMLMQTPQDGYIGTCAAIAGTDFYTPTSGLRVPTLGIAGAQDKATPPDLVRETVDLIPGSQFVLMRRAGHLPCAEDPEGYAAHLTDFLRSIGHLPT